MPSCGYGLKKESFATHRSRHVHDVQFEVQLQVRLHREKHVHLSSIEVHLKYAILNPNLAIAAENTGAVGDNLVAAVIAMIVVVVVFGMDSG